jgi:signal transduction histidine kinase
LPLTFNRFLPRLRAAGQPHEAGHTERVLAAARVMLVLAALVALALDPAQPTRFAPLAYLLSDIYLLYSLLVLAWLRYHAKPTRGFQVWLQAADVVWPVLLSVFTADLGSAFFLFYVFVLLESAYRWGLKETLATAAAMAALVLARDFLSVSGPGLPQTLRKASPWALFMMRGPYLLIMGYLAGYLGEREKVPRWMAVATVRTLGEVQLQMSLRGAVRVALEATCKLAGARRAMIVLEEVATRRAFLWDAQFNREGEEAMTLTSTELDTSQRALYVFRPPGDAWHARHIEQTEGHSASCDLLVLNEDAERLRQVAWTLPQALLAAHPFHSLLGVSSADGSSWLGEVLLFDPDLGSGRQMALRFFQTLSRQLSPAVLGIFLARRLRSRAGAAERARVARELHDGVIQSLISLEMQVDVLRRRPDVEGTAWARELTSIQSLVRGEILSVRELMQQMRPLDLGPKQLLEFLAFTVERFRNETNITASFVSPLEDVRLPPAVCSEVARIVQEALVNVRRHSGARNVVVRFESAEGTWKLVVDDDGRGFDFAGRLTHAELDAARKGPLVIKERVRSIGGELTVESLPGRGARLEITLPHKAHER